MASTLPILSHLHVGEDLRDDLPFAVLVVFLNRKFVPAKLQTFLTELAAWENSTWHKEHAAGGAARQLTRRHE